MIWHYKFIRLDKNIAWKMLLSPANKSGDSFNFFLEKSIALWEPSLKTPFLQNTSRRLLLSFYRKILTNLKNVRQTKVQKGLIYRERRKAWNKVKRTQMPVPVTDTLTATDKG